MSCSKAHQEIFDIVALAAAIGTAIPWGSFSNPASKAKEVASQKAKEVPWTNGWRRVHNIFVYDQG